MKNITSIENKTFLANQIAEQIKEKYLAGKSPERDLFECFSCFNEDAGSTFEEFQSAERLLIELSCILSNPDFSSKLSSYYRTHASRILLRMIDFFNSLSTDDVIQMFIMYKNLKYFSAPVEDLVDIERRFLEIA